MKTSMNTEFCMPSNKHVESTFTFPATSRFSHSVSRFNGFPQSPRLSFDILIAKLPNIALICEQFSFEILSWKNEEAAWF